MLAAQLNVIELQVPSALQPQAARHRYLAGLVGDGETFFYTYLTEPIFADRLCASGSKVIQSTIATAIWLAGTSGIVALLSTPSSIIAATDIKPSH
jgi:hypothetical protein